MMGGGGQEARRPTQAADGPQLLPARATIGSPLQTMREGIGVDAGQLAGALSSVVLMGGPASPSHGSQAIPRTTSGMRCFDGGPSPRAVSPTPGALDREVREF